MVSVDVRNGAGRRARAEVVREVARRLGRAMEAAGVGRAEVALSFTDDVEIRALNAAYAGEDHATDVLSFSQAEGAPMPGGADVLGDIVISVEYAARQAKEGGRALVDELAHLAVHGLAHLLGFDHATPEEERVMFGYEARLRAVAEKRGAIARVRRPRTSAQRRRRA
jgi:probable rRNA maturation factor